MTAEQDVQVMQEDRDRAMPIMHHLYVVQGEKGALFLGDIAAGKHDDHYLVQAFARHRIEATRTVQTELLEALRACLTFLDSAPLESGYCCCGDAVDAHNMGSGHAPVDDLAYYAGQVAERARAILAKHGATS